LDAVDIHTGWVERQAVRGKGQHSILEALTTIEQQLPCALRGLDSDNGSEFINSHLVGFCQRRRIQFTRSRPYKKDDNGHVEQKNWTHMRQLVGWDRYDTPAAQHALNDLYAELRLFQNLFQSSMKSQRKERRGSRLLRRYDPPRTPFERVRASAAVDAGKVIALERLFGRTDPFVLTRSTLGSTWIAWRACAVARRRPLFNVAPGGAAGPSVPEHPRHGPCPTFGAHNWLRSDDRPVGQSRRREELRGVWCPQTSVRTLDDATTRARVRNSDGLIGTRPEVRGIPPPATR
jgi:hypothetical protein